MTKNVLELISITFLALLAACSTTNHAVRTSSIAPKMGPSVEGVTEYKLHNGLTVLLFPDQSISTVTVNVTYLVGSRHEGRGENGMAHLLEHMLFKGSTKFPNIDAVMQKHGAFSNASTWYDRTNYFERLQASDENLEFALRLEADRMVNSFVRQEDLDKEMTVVRNEFEIGENDPVNALQNQVSSAAYRWHSYGKPTIGNQSDIERVPATALRKFYKNFYQPDNAVVLIAGNFKPEKALSIIQKTFGTIAKPTRILQNTYTVEPQQDGPINVTVNRVGDVAATMLAYHIPAGTHPDFASVLVMNELLTDEPTGALYHSLVSTGMASAVYGWSYPLKEPGLLMMFASAGKNENIENLRDRMIKDVETNAYKMIDEKSVARAKVRLLKQFKLAQTDTARLALSMSEAIALGDWRTYFWGRDMIERVTIQDVHSVASKYLISTNRTTGMFVPTKDPLRAKIEESPSVESLLSGYTGKQSVTKGESFAMTIENIKAHIETDSLADGTKILGLPKKARGDAISMGFRFKIGTKESMVGFREELELLPDLLMRGSKNRDFAQINERLDELQSILAIDFDASGFIIASIKSDRQHVSDVISLLAEILKLPSFNEEQFEIVKIKSIKEIEKSLSEPDDLARNELSRMANPWPKGNILHVPTLEERLTMLKNVSLNNLRELHKNLYGANKLEVAVIGSYDRELLKRDIAYHFADWRAPVSYERIERPFVEAVGQQKTIVTKDKKMGYVGMVANLHMRDDDINFASLRLANYILGETTSSRLWKRLRETEGLSYSVGSSLWASSFDKTGQISMGATCAAQNVKRAQKLMTEEFETWRTQLKFADLEAHKKGFRAYFENSLANDWYVVGMFLENLNTGRTLDFQSELLAKVDKMSAHDMSEALRLHLGGVKLAQVRAGDFPDDKTAAS